MSMNSLGHTAMERRVVDLEQRVLDLAKMLRSSQALAEQSEARHQSAIVGFAGRVKMLEKLAGAELLTPAAALSPWQQSAQDRLSGLEQKVAAAFQEHNAIQQHSTLILLQMGERLSHLEAAVQDRGYPGPQVASQMEQLQARLQALEAKLTDEVSEGVTSRVRQEVGAVTERWGKDLHARLQQLEDMLAGSMAGLQGAVESCITHPEAEVMISRSIKAAFAAEAGTEGSTLLAAAAQAAQLETDRLNAAIQQVRADTMTRHEAAQLLKLMDALTSLHSNVLPPLQQLSSIWPGLCNLLGSLLQASNQHKVQEYQQQATQAQADANWQQGSARQAEGQNIQTQQPGSRTAQLSEATRLAQQGESLLRLVMGQVEAAHIVAEVAKRSIVGMESELNKHSHLVVQPQQLYTARETAATGSHPHQKHIHQEVLEHGLGKVQEEIQAVMADLRHQVQQVVAVSSGPVEQSATMSASACTSLTTAPRDAEVVLQPVENTMEHLSARGITQAAERGIALAHKIARALNAGSHQRHSSQAGKDRAQRVKNGLPQENSATLQATEVQPTQMDQHSSQQAPIHNSQQAGRPASGACSAGNVRHVSVPAVPQPVTLTAEDVARRAKLRQMMTQLNVKQQRRAKAKPPPVTPAASGEHHT